MMVSFLHLGQKRGKLNIAVSGFTFILVLAPQVGQRTHFDSSRFSLTLNPPVLNSSAFNVWLVEELR